MDGSISEVSIPAAAHPGDDASFSLISSPLTWRVAILGMLLALEWLPISALVSTGSGGQSVARALVASVSIFLTCACLRRRDAIRQLSGGLRRHSVSWVFLTAHFAVLAAFLALSEWISGRAAGAQPILLTVIWFGLGTAGLALAAAAFIAPRLWRDLVRGASNLWIYSLVAGVVSSKLVVTLSSVWNQSSWQFVTDATFAGVKALLGLVLSDVVADRALLTIGSSTFQVTIGPACSGLEGAGLILAFTIVWLFFFRREYRFPNALILVPVGVATMFALNIVRIAALILIGNAGAEKVAVSGFHSQAGWIAFNAVALVFLLIVPRLAWLTTTDSLQPMRATGAPNATSPYLAPFAAILAAAMLSRAFSAGFEWLYPMRFLAAAAALWVYRRRYGALSWKPHWWSFVAGAAVFPIWLALDRGPHGNNGIADGLASLPHLTRTGWVVCRVLAGVITVPVAEELAFRGFLLRRLMSSDFESISLRKFTYPALAGSSIVFGLMHGSLWIGGTLAGVIYAAVMLRRGSIGDAVAAHGTTNALIAVWVLAGGHWYLW